MTESHTLKVPALAFCQGDDRYLYSFAVEGSRLKEFASVSRIERKDHESIDGYQRPEVLSHIMSIKKYLLSEKPMLPNAIVVAFEDVVKFEPLDVEAPLGIQIGQLHIPIDSSLEDHKKPAWIVDGQQRTAALTKAAKENFHVGVIGFIAQSHNEQREQFMLVNSTLDLSLSTTSSKR
jgi:DGQHR domain-containing protein